jgi:hypothetical protein
MCASQSLGVVAVLVVIVVTYVGGAKGWGPLSHYFFARQAYEKQGYDDASIKLGCDMPDSFYFANWAQFPNCQVPINDYHNPITAGYFVKFALSDAAKRLQMKTQLALDPLSLSLGYGSHMIADRVGFYSPKGGYLGPTVPSYVTAFPFMTAVDALISTLSTFPDSPWASEDAAVFIAEATKYYNSKNSKFPLYNSTQIGNCILPWGRTATTVVELAKIQAKTQYYQQALVFFDQFNATTFDEALSHWKIANECCVDAIRFWRNQILGATTPEDAWKFTNTHITTKFEKGQCTTSLVK